MTQPPAVDDRMDRALRLAGLPPLPRPAWLAIDLDALASNLAALRALLPPGTPIEPVVKADAYGHGAVPVARWLERHGVHGFGVATLDEALELRRGGVERPILVLYPIAPEVVAKAAEAAVSVTLGDPVLAERAVAAMSEGDGPPLSVHIEIETGLGRGGLLPDAARALAARLRGAARVRIAGVWSHLGSPEDPDRSTRQGETFDALRASLAAVGGDEAAIRWHLAASGGLLSGTAAPLDGVRLGLALYGVIPDDLVAATIRSGSPLRPAMSLHARPVRVVDLPAGTAIGYGRFFVAGRTSRIATLAVGYADGYHRARSGHAEVLVRARRAPVVGTIAMDALMVDVTDVPRAGEPAVSIDDEFVLLGEQGGDRITALDLARLGTTISWEVLAGMARRLPRVYYAGAVPVGLRTLTEERGWWTEPGRTEPPG